jgi:hypothetical protein
MSGTVKSSSTAMMSGADKERNKTEEDDGMHDARSPIFKRLFLPEHLHHELDCAFAEVVDPHVGAPFAPAIDVAQHSPRHYCQHDERRTIHRQRADCLTNIPVNLTEGFGHTELPRASWPETRMVAQNQIIAAH